MDPVRGSNTMESSHRRFRCGPHLQRTLRRPAWSGKWRGGLRSGSDIFDRRSVSSIETGQGAFSFYDRTASGYRVELSWQQPPRASLRLALHFLYRGHSGIDLCCPGFVNLGTAAWFSRSSQDTRHSQANGLAISAGVVHSEHVVDHRVRRLTQLQYVCYWRILVAFPATLSPPR